MSRLKQKQELFFSQPAQKQMDLILSRPDVKAYVQTVPPQDLYLLLKEVGLTDATELLVHCSPEQIQACFDLDVWKRDHIVANKMIAWLEALYEVSPSKLAQVVDVLDHEFVVSWLQQEIRVYDLSIEEPPDEPEDHFYGTPDRFYVVDVLSKEHGVWMDRLISALYERDLDLGRRIMMGVKWDIGAETEETAYRFHIGRMADLGFVDQYEALEIYRVLSPDSVRMGEGSGPPFSDPSLASTDTAFLPTDWIDRINSKSLFLSVVLSSLPIREGKVVLRYLIYLINRALSAELLDITDADSVASVMDSTIGFVSMGLEYLVKNTDSSSGVVPVEKGKEVTLPIVKENQWISLGMSCLRTVSVKRLFQVGYSLTMQLVQVAHLLLRQGVTSLVPKEDPGALLDEVRGEVLRLLLRGRRPGYVRALDGDNQKGERAFSSLADIRRVAQCLDEIDTLARFMTHGLGVRIDTLSSTAKQCQRALSDIGWMDVLGTMCSQFILGRPPVFVLLSHDDVTRLCDEALPPGESPTMLRPAVTKKLHEMLKIRVQERSVDANEESRLWSTLTQSFAQEAMAALKDALCILRGEPHRAFRFQSMPQSGLLWMLRPPTEGIPEHPRTKKGRR